MPVQHSVEHPRDHPWFREEQRLVQDAEVAENGSFAGVIPRNVRPFSLVDASTFRDESSCHQASIPEEEDHGFVWGGINGPSTMDIADDEEEKFGFLPPSRVIFDFDFAGALRAEEVRIRTASTTVQPETTNTDESLPKLNFEAAHPANNVDIGCIPESKQEQHFPSLLNEQESTGENATAPNAFLPIDEVLAPHLDLTKFTLIATESSDPQDVTQSSSTITYVPKAPQTTMGTYSKADRERKIKRYRNKRGKRVWDKKINYSCRKSFADRRPRIGGRFISKEEHQALKEKQRAEVWAQRASQEVSQGALLGTTMTGSHQGEGKGDTPSKVHKYATKSSDEDTKLSMQFTSLGVANAKSPLAYGNYSSGGHAFKFGLSHPDSNMLHVR